MNTSMRLTLCEKLMLLMLDQQSGRWHSWVHSHGLYLGAAVFTDLILWDRIRLTKGKKPKIEIQSLKKTGSPLHDAWLMKVSQSQKMRPIYYWLNKIVVDPKLSAQVADGLIAKGLISREKQPYLWFFKRTIYPTLNSHPHRRLCQGLRRAIIGQERHLSMETRVLVYLGQQCGLWRAVFGKDFVREHKERIRDIAEHKLGGANLMKFMEMQAALNLVYTNINQLSGIYS